MVQTQDSVQAALQATAPLLLLESLAADLPPDWISATLARRRRWLEQLVQEQRPAPGWGATRALQLAHLLLAAGLPGRGDDLVLEAHALAPQASVIPDWWGLWPIPEPVEPEQQAVRTLAASYVQLRHQPAQQLWRLWCDTVEADRLRLEDAALQLLLGLVINGRLQLAEELEQGLAQRLDDALIQEEPALAWQWLEPLCERLPDWDYGRIKAADLALQRGELHRSRAILEGATTAQQQLVWLHDVAARLDLANGEVAAALGRWQLAIEHCRGDVELAELFRQRAREARRGAGVLQVRSLLNNGLHREALQLLEQLLAQDPHWQPLRSLRDQARQHDPQAATTPDTAPPSAEVEALEQLLRRLAERGQLAWPPAAPLPPPRDAAAAEQFVQEAMGRLVLLD
jgi:hypothetical protein